MILFTEEAEDLLSNQFYEQGFVIRSVADFKLFENIRGFLADAVAKFLGSSVKDVG